MLTESEKRWLQLRKLYAGVNHLSYYSCMHCQSYNVDRWDRYNYPCNNACVYEGCPNIDIRSSQALSDYVEAIEFEARVVAKLTMMMLCPNDEKYPCRHGEPKLGCMRLKTKLTSTFAVHCEDCILRKVHLQVEEEMDNDS